ncbi:hypothetical protein [Cellulomonas iranensis]|uniref:hypothetical protein n=1 Tax=Cellulomonas iranensis TaxID=76862 RepID=UPI0013D39E6C|nr:hypothetical protein [Cellulomonas iranensis]
MNATLITDQQAALVAKRWEGRDGTVRYYIEDWATLVGVELGRYKNGGIRWATYRGQGISNTKVSRLLAGRLWIENGKVYSTIDWNGAGVEKPESLRTLVLEAVENAARA